MGRVWWLALAAACAGCGAPENRGPVLARSAAASVEVASDGLRSGWYPDEPLLAPARVSAPDFGQLFDTPINGEVHAQPLVANARLLIVTEANEVYSLDPVTGAVLAHRTLHVPWSPSGYADQGLNCIPLQPSVGVMGTPAIDPASNTAYFVAKTYASGNSGPAVFWAHAVDVSSLAERPGFPVLIQGNADNFQGLAFDGTYHVQRPGLVLLGGVVYAGFAGVCDAPPWKGWLIGISSAGAITARWSAEPPGSNGAGIWQTGGAPMVDGPGTLVVSTGNGPTPAQPTPGAQPPSALGQAWIRLQVQPDGTLAATDFFMPYDARQLNTWDGDLGSGAPMGLPDAFGTPSIPHLSVVTGKQGYVYLVNRDNLGGYQQGPSGGDAVLQRLGPYGGVWGKPSAWPGSGGWVYLPTVSAGSTPGGSSGTFDVYQASVDGSGNPTLARVAQADGAFGLGTSAPLVTSDGTTPGSALVWLMWSANNTGYGAELRAYDAVPVAGKLLQRYRASIGKATRYAPPGVAGGRVYVATGDGHVKGFGAPVDPVLSAPTVDFGAVQLGSSSTQQATFTARRAATVTGVTAQGDFAVQGVQPALPAALVVGQTLTVQVAFTPSSVGIQAAALVADTDQGPFSTSLAGVGQSQNGDIQPAPVSISFGGIATGRTVSSAVTLTNVGGAPATIVSATPPGAPFSATGLPAPSTVIPPGDSVTVTLEFAPTTAGQFEDQLTIVTDRGTVEVPMSGTSASSGILQLSTAVLDFGTVRVGERAGRSFTLRNVGGTRLRVNKSQPPGLQVGFSTTTQLPEGTTVDPGAETVLEVDFQPTKSGAAQDRWLITADDGQGPQEVVVSGEGTDGAAHPAGGCDAPGGPFPAGGLGLLLWWLSARQFSWRRRNARATAPGSPALRTAL